MGNFGPYILLFLRVISEYMHAVDSESSPSISSSELAEDAATAAEPFASNLRKSGMTEESAPSLGIGVRAFM